MSFPDIVRLGVLTDIQYADKPDSKLPWVGQLREYQKVLPKLESAVEYLNKHSLSLVLHLGDIVDGNKTLDQTREDLEAVLSRLEQLKAPVCHVLGNHCLDVERDYLVRRLKLDKGAYYHVDVSDKWRFIMVDTVDMSVSREQGTSLRKLADEYLHDHEGEENAKPWNGGIGPEQMKWLSSTLVDARKKNRFVIVCGHMPILPQAATGMHCAWDSAAIEEVLVQSEVVKAYFCGHCHEGGYAFCRGIHHVTFEALLDSDDDGAVGVIELHDEEIVVNGKGLLSSRRLSISQGDE